MNPGGYWYGYGYQQPQVGTLDLVLSFGLGADLGNGYGYSQPMVHFHIC